MSDEQEKEDAFVMDHCHKSANKATEEHLIAFKDGSYKKVRPVYWKHSQWIHLTKENGQVVMINPINVNYIERFSLDKLGNIDNGKESTGAPERDAL